MSTDCTEYRKGMELLSLKVQLEKGIPDPVKRREIGKRIKELEQELELD